MKVRAKDAGWISLYAAVCHRAVMDYMETLLSNDEGRRKEVTKFFMCNPYDITPELGEQIMLKAKRKLYEAENFIIDYINDGDKYMIIPNQLNIDSLNVLIKFRYTNISIKKLYPNRNFSPLVIHKVKRGHYFGRV